VAALDSIYGNILNEAWSKTIAGNGKNTLIVHTQAEFKPEDTYYVFVCKPATGSTGTNVAYGWQTRPSIIDFNTKDNDDQWNNLRVIEDKLVKGSEVVSYIKNKEAKLLSGITQYLLDIRYINTQVKDAVYASLYTNTKTGPGRFAAGYFLVNANMAGSPDLRVYYKIVKTLFNVNLSSNSDPMYMAAETLPYIDDLIKAKELNQKNAADTGGDWNPAGLLEAIDWNAPFPYGKVEDIALPYIKSKDPALSDSEVKEIYLAFYSWLEKYEDIPDDVGLQGWYDNAVENYRDADQWERRGMDEDEQAAAEDGYIDAAENLLQSRINEFFNSQDYKDFLAARALNQKNAADTGGDWNPAGLLESTATEERVSKAIDELINAKTYEDFLKVLSRQMPDPRNTVNGTPVHLIIKYKISDKLGNLQGDGSDSLWYPQTPQDYFYIAYYYGTYRNLNTGRHENEMAKAAFEKWRDLKATQELNQKNAADTGGDWNPAGLLENKLSFDASSEYFDFVKFCKARGWSEEDIIEFSEWLCTKSDEAETFYEYGDPEASEAWEKVSTYYDANVENAAYQAREFNNITVPGYIKEIKKEILNYHKQFEDYKQARALDKKNAADTGGDWEPEGLLEGEEICEQATLSPNGELKFGKYRIFQSGSGTQSAPYAQAINDTNLFSKRLANDVKALEPLGFKFDTVYYYQPPPQASKYIARAIAISGTDNNGEDIMWVRKGGWQAPSAVIYYKDRRGGPIKSMARKLGLQNAPVVTAELFLQAAVTSGLVKSSKTGNWVYKSKDINLRPDGKYDILGEVHLKYDYSRVLVGKPFYINSLDELPVKFGVINGALSVSLPVVNLDWFPEKVEGKLAFASESGMTPEKFLEVGLLDRVTDDTEIIFFHRGHTYKRFKSKTEWQDMIKAAELNKKNAADTGGDWNPAGLLEAKLSKDGTVVYTQADLPDWVTSNIDVSSFGDEFWTWFLTQYLKDMGFSLKPDAENLSEMIGQLLYVFIEDSLGENPANISHQQYNKAIAKYFDSLKDKIAADELNKKNAADTGGDWNPAGLLESWTDKDIEDHWDHYYNVGEPGPIGAIKNWPGLSFFNAWFVDKIDKENWNVDSIEEYYIEYSERVADNLEQKDEEHTSFDELQEIACYRGYKKLYNFYKQFLSDTNSPFYKDWKATDELNQKNAAATGGDWNPAGLLEGASKSVNHIKRYALMKWADALSGSKEFSLYWAKIHGLNEDELEEFGKGGLGFLDNFIDFVVDMKADELEVAELGGWQNKAKKVYKDKDEHIDAIQKWEDAAVDIIKADILKHYNIWMIPARELNKKNAADTGGDWDPEGLLEGEEKAYVYDKDQVTESIDKLLKKAYKAKTFEEFLAAHDGIDPRMWSTSYTNSIYYTSFLNLFGKKWKDMEKETSKFGALYRAIERLGFYTLFLNTDYNPYHSIVATREYKIKNALKSTKRYFDIYRDIADTEELNQKNAADTGGDWNPAGLLEGSKDVSYPKVHDSIKNALDAKDFDSFKKNVLLLPDPWHYTIMTNNKLNTRAILQDIFKLPQPPSSFNPVTPLDYFLAAVDHILDVEYSNAASLDDISAGYSIAKEYHAKWLDHKAAEELNQKNAAATGGDWNPAGLLETPVHFENSDGTDWRQKDKYGRTLSEKQWIIEIEKNINQCLKAVETGDFLDFIKAVDNRLANMHRNTSSVAHGAFFKDDVFTKTLAKVFNNDAVESAFDDAWYAVQSMLVYVDVHRKGKYDGNPANLSKVDSAEIRQNYPRAQARFEKFREIYKDYLAARELNQKNAADTGGDWNPAGLLEASVDYLKSDKGKVIDNYINKLVNANTFEEFSDIVDKKPCPFYQNPKTYYNDKLIVEAINKQLGKHDPVSGNPLRTSFVTAFVATQTLLSWMDLFYKDKGGKILTPMVKQETAAVKEKFDEWLAARTDWYAAQELNKKNAADTGGDWNPAGLLESEDYDDETPSYERYWDNAIEGMTSEWARSFATYIDPVLASKLITWMLNKSRVAHNPQATYNNLLDMYSKFMREREIKNFSWPKTHDLPTTGEVLKDIIDAYNADQLNQKNAAATGGDWDPAGLMEAYFTDIGKHYTDSFVTILTKARNARAFSEFEAAFDNTNPNIWNNNVVDRYTYVKVFGDVITKDPLFAETGGRTKFGYLYKAVELYGRYCLLTKTNVEDDRFSNKSVKLETAGINKKEAEKCFNRYLDFIKAEELNQKNAAVTGGDWDPAGLLENIEFEGLTEQQLAEYIALMVEAARVLSLNPAGLVVDTERAKLQPSNYWPKITPNDTFEGIRENYLTALNAAVKFDLYNGNYTPVMGTFKRSQFRPEVIGSLRSGYQFTPGNLNTADAKQAIKDEIESKGYKDLVNKMYEVNKDSFWMLSTPWHSFRSPWPNEVFAVIKNFVAGKNLDRLKELYLSSSHFKAQELNKKNAADTGGDWNPAGLLEAYDFSPALEGRKPAISPSGWRINQKGLKFTGNISPDGQSGEYIHPVQKYIFWLDKNGVKHRTDGPAYISKTGNKEWFVNGVCHRLDGPAIESSNGDKEWLVNGVRHRLDGPALEWKNGLKKWYVNGKQHRLDGPASIYPNGHKYWYINGVQYTDENEFNKVIADMKAAEELNKKNAADTGGDWNPAGLLEKIN
jgi:hypothetical protein